MNLDGNFPSYEKQLEILNKTTGIKNAVDAGTIGKTPRRQIFTSNGIWTVPEGVTRVFVTGGGGGGGGGYINGTTVHNGTTGGVTSFGSFLSLSGGGGGKTQATSSNGDLGGLAGGPGGQAGVVYMPSSAASNAGGDGGNSGPFFGGRGRTVNAPNIYSTGGYCSGGGGAAYTSSGGVFAGGGGGGDFVFNREIPVNPGSTIPITIGVGGTNAANQSTGGGGILIIEWWE